MGLRPILTHRHAILPAMDRDQLFPKDGPPDVRGILRVARAHMATARRARDARAIRGARRLAVKCLRALRYEAKMKAGRARPRPGCSHPLFSDVLKKVVETSAATATPNSDRRHAFREGRRRR